jgi:hypothetical protein
MTIEAEQNTWLNQIINQNLRQVDKRVAAQIYHQFVLHTHDLPELGDRGTMNRLIKKAKIVLSKEEIEQINLQHAAQSPHSWQTFDQEIIKRV